MSGLGTRPGRHRQTGLPPKLGLHVVVPGKTTPQGSGLQGSGLEHWIRGCGSGRSPCSPSLHLHMASPSWGMHMAVGWHGLGTQGFLGGSGGGSYFG